MQSKILEQRRMAGWLLTGLLLLCGVGCSRTSTAPTGATAQAFLVRTQRVGEADFMEIARTQGTVEPRNRAKISARLPGIIEEMKVEEGSVVQRGDVLFQTEKINVELEAESARRALSAAAAACVVARAGLAESEALLEKARKDAGRMQRLFEEDHAISVDQWEQAQTGLKRAQASWDLAAARVAQSRAQEEQAEFINKIALKKKEDSRVCAPFAGTVTRREQDRGDYAGAGQAVMILESSDTPDLVFVLDAPLFSRVAPGKTVLQFCAASGESGNATIRQLAPAVHPATRTFEVKAGAPESLRVPSGTLVDVTVILGRRHGIAVPDAAICGTGNDAEVFIIEAGKAQAVPVRIGLHEDGMTELIGAAALLNKKLVVEGQLQLREGAPVEEMPCRP